MCVYNIYHWIHMHAYNNNAILIYAVPPTLRAVPQNGEVSARKGSTVTLECKASGNPVPSIYWFKKVGCHRITLSSSASTRSATWHFLCSFLQSYFVCNIYIFFPFLIAFCICCLYSRQYFLQLYHIYSCTIDSFVPPPQFCSYIIEIARMEMYEYNIDVIYILVHRHIMNLF